MGFLENYGFYKTFHENTLKTGFSQGLHINCFVLLDCIMGILYWKIRGAMITVVAFAIKTAVLMYTQMCDTTGYNNTVS